MARFRACFAELVDPRTGNAQRHDLLEILLIALAATLCGAEGGVDMARFGRAKAPFLRRCLRLEGVPEHHRRTLSSPVQAPQRRPPGRGRAQPLADRKPPSLGARRGHG